MDFKIKLTVCSSPVKTRPDRDLQDMAGVVKQMDCFGCVFVNKFSLKLVLIKKKSKTSPNADDESYWMIWVDIRVFQTESNQAHRQYILRCQRSQ
jgi:hypothetical protein